MSIYENMIPPDYPTCPECGSEDFRADKWSNECAECGYKREKDFDEDKETKENGNE